MFLASALLVCLVSSASHAQNLDSLARADSIRRAMPFPGADSSEFFRPFAGDSLRARLDSLRARGDTLKIDTSRTWVVYKDSTVRIAQFVHKRHDSPVVELFPRPNYSLYLDPYPAVYKRDIEIDSSGNTVTATERVNDKNVKVPQSISLDDYIHQRYRQENLRIWRSFITPYTMRQNQDELGGLLGNFTNISIPVPANPIFSIFGKNYINIRVNGGVDIRGAFKNETSDQQTISQLDRSRSEPNFNQDVQINVNGTIGDKLNILADWNTQRTFEYENQLKIKYTGYDDEIIQSIEAGNVSLQTPSLVGGGQALFGIKAKMQMGPLTLTSLVSQKKGQTKELTVSGGATSNDITIFPQQYSTNHFFVDIGYRDFYEQLHAAQSPLLTQEILNKQIVLFDVYASVTSVQQVNNGQYVIGKAFIGLPARIGPNYQQSDLPANTAPGQFEEGYFIRLTPNKDFSIDQYGGIINLNTSLSEEQVLAISYTTNSQEYYGGKLGTSDTLILKLIKPKQLSNNPAYHPAWDLMLKNIYPLHLSNVKKQGFSLSILRRTDGAEINTVIGQPLLSVLGLDRYDNNNAPHPNNEFDFIPGLTIDVDHGEIIFPTLRPFDSTIVRYFAALSPPQTVPDSLRFPQLYDTTSFAAGNDNIRNKYYLKITASGSQSSRFQLGFNIVEGSVQVLFNGAPMLPNVDYTVDYIIGEVVIRRPEALLPGANVQVKYEQNDLFQLASKTLLGARGELALWPNTSLGFTAMNLNQATLSDKVRLNEEPTNNLIVGTDFSSSFNLPFLTSAIDALPLIRTKEMSSIRFGGEAAYSLPDPNTKKSLVAGDNNLSIAYIDDFEGARRTIPLPVSYVAWTLASAPFLTFLGPAASDSDKNATKAQLSWYNVLPTDVLSQEIWPNRATRSGQNQVTVLNMDFDPNHRGVYNFSPHLDQTLHRTSIGPNTGTADNPVERRKNWNGIMRYIGASAGGILEQNITSLEIWVKANPSDPADLSTGRLLVDLGRISEAIIPTNPKRLFSEDHVRTPENPDGIANGVRNPGEDVGLDMLNDSQEDTAYASFLQSNQGDPDVDPNDPSGDDWQPYVTGTKNPLRDLRKFNGTENNANDPAGLLPNTEDLNGNGVLDADDQYLEYEIPLDTTGNPLHIGGQNGWYQFHIPLLQATRILPSPGDSASRAAEAQSILQNVQYVRLWVSGFSSPVQIRIAEMDLVGNQWLERTKDDSVLKVSVVNIEDNPDYYRDWQELGIVRQKDRTDPNQVIEGNEQSLALVIKDLGRDSSREAVKSFNVRPLDLFNYKTMKMFVHGDPTFSFLSPEIHDADIYLRFGSDSLNYYEYRAPIHPGWDVSENNMNISFAQVTALKSSRDSSSQYLSRPVTGGPPGARYGVKGNPSLRQIREISIGVVNLGTGRISGQVWVNELRLVDVDNSSGVAYRFDTQIKLADLGNIGFNYSQTDPHFHALDQRFGSQNTNANWSVNANAALEKFFPPEWQGTTLPVAYTHSEQLVKPKYLPNTDVVVTEAAALASARAAQDSTATPKRIAFASDDVISQSQTLGVTNSYSIPNFRLAFPTQLWYVRDTFSKLSYSFTYNTARFRDPTIAERYSWFWNLRVNYSVNIPSDYYVQPFKGLFAGVFLLDAFKDWKFYYMPILSISTSAGGNRSRSYEIARVAGSVPRENRNFGASKSFGFNWRLTEGGLTNLSGDYGLSIDRNLVNLDNDSTGRGFGSLMKSLFFGGRDGRYGQRVSINTHPKIPDILDIPRYLDINGGYSVNYSWQNTFQQGDIGKSAGWDNNINASFAFRLKSLTDPWFDSRGEEAPLPQPKSPKSPSDTSKGTENKPEGGSKSLLKQLKSLARVFIKIPFLDYETINITFSQTNQSGNGAVLGQTGFKNFWGRLPFQGSLERNGPSRLYQLGLISDPSGTLRYSPSSSFPFIGWKVIPGRRAPGAVIPDRFAESNTIALRTNRPLWQGATLELNWKVGWQFAKSTAISTDSLGYQHPGEPQTAGSIERSFLSLPPVLFFKVFKSNLEDVGNKFDKLQKARIDETERASFAKTDLAEAFEKGFEALPFLNRLFGQYVPRPNWTLRWDGIERVIGIGGFIERMSFENAYTSTFRRDYRGYTGLGDQTDAERVTYGFSPLAGINASFRQFLKGTMSGTFRYNSTNAYDLNLAASPANIVETASREISLSLTYSRKGFSFPLFGLNLSNDMDVSFTFSLTKNNHTRYDPVFLSSNQEGIPLEGSTRTQYEPRIRYVLSTRVTASIFYRYAKTAPDEGGSLIYGITTNEAGIDIHISI